MAEKKTDVFNTLNAINVNDRTEKKNGLTYLSWAWAWGEVKKIYPDATYTVYENANGWNYHTDGKTCWVKTGVTIKDQEYIEYLPVMDYKNRSIPLDMVTSFDVNKAIQRSITKAIGRHGLGLYIYAGEDIPEETPAAAPEPKATQKPVAEPKPANRVRPDNEIHLNEAIGTDVGMGVAERLRDAGVNLEFVLRKYGREKFADFTWREANNAMKNIDKILEKQKEAEELKK